MGGTGVFCDGVLEKFMQPSEPARWVSSQMVLCRLLRELQTGREQTHCISAVSWEANQTEGKNAFDANSSLKPRKVSTVVMVISAGQNET